MAPAPMTSGPTTSGPATSRPANPAPAAAASVTLDRPRRQLRDALAVAGLSLKQASRAIGRNDAYLQQFLFRGSPRRLPEEARHALAAMLGIDQQILADLPQSPHMSTGPSSGRPAASPANQILVPLFDVRAAAGGGAIPPGEESVDGMQPPNIGFPPELLRRITSAPAASLQMISVSGDSMTPTLADGDLVMIDTARKLPSPPGIFILDDGVGLVAKRVDTVPNTTPPILRLSSDNPAYANYQRRLDEVHVIGRVIWFGRSL